jgi:hypothetical protein
MNPLRQVHFCQTALVLAVIALMTTLSCPDSTYWFLKNNFPGNCFTSRFISRQPRSESFARSVATVRTEARA